MYRIFIAIDLPPDIKTDIATMCVDIPDAKWVHKENLHITLKFLGNMQKPDLENLIEHIENNIVFKEFSLKLDKIGTFPIRKTPNILWIGVQKNHELEKLFKKIDHQLSKLGFNKEKRKFHPHLTIARFKKNPIIQKISNFISCHTEYSSRLFTISSFSIYSSLLTSHRAYYEKIATISCT